MVRELLNYIPIEGLFGIAGGLLFAIGYIIVTRRRALELIRRWAASQHLKIVRAKRRTFVPFLTPAKGQFFRVSLADSSGAIRECWLRVQDSTTDPEEVQVDWDDKAATLL